jgi:F0F1-type ATP synthase assembly protein I
MKKNNPQNSKADSAGNWMAFLNLGWLIAANMLFFVGGGLWLDRHFGTAPVLLLVGVFSGFFACGYTLYRAVKKLEGEEAPQPPS